MPSRDLTVISTLTLGARNWRLPEPKTTTAGSFVEKKGDEPKKLLELPLEEKRILVPTHG
jgi:hypothetical protein